MMHDQHSTAGQVARMVLAFIAWVGTVELSEWSSVVSIVGGIALIIYTVSNTYVLWKERILRKDRKKQEQLHKDDAK